MRRTASASGVMISGGESDQNSRHHMKLHDIACTDSLSLRATVLRLAEWPECLK